MIKRLKENYRQTDNTTSVLFWDYQKNDLITQIEHNKSLFSLIKRTIEGKNLNILITSPEISTILDSIEENFQIIESNKYLVGETTEGFEPIFLIINDGKKIGLVIKDETRFNTIVLTDSYGGKRCDIVVKNIPTISLLDFFNKN